MTGLERGHVAEQRHVLRLARCHPAIRAANHADLDRPPLAVPGERALERVVDLDAIRDRRDVSAPGGDRTVLHGDDGAPEDAAGPAGRSARLMGATVVACVAGAAARTIPAAHQPIVRLKSSGKTPPRSQASGDATDVPQAGSVIDGFRDVRDTHARRSATQRRERGSRSGEWESAARHIHRAPSGLPRLERPALLIRQGGLSDVAAG